MLYMNIVYNYTGPTNTESTTRPPTALDDEATKSKPTPWWITRNVAVDVQIQPSPENQGTCHVDHK